MAFGILRMIKELFTVFPYSLVTWSTVVLIIFSIIFYLRDKRELKKFFLGDKENEN